MAPPKPTFPVDYQQFTATPSSIGSYAKSKIPMFKVQPELHKQYNQNVQRYYGVDKESGLIGLEIECEGKNLFTVPISYWNLHEEHSLRKYEGHSPAEYALIRPLSRDKLVDALDYLLGMMSTNKSEVVPSPRTSVHVHLNVQQLTIKQVLTFVCCYLLLEDLLVAYSGPSRVGNLFCLRARDAEHFLHAIEKSIKDDNYGPGSLIGDSELRYSSINLAALPKFGSLEFRSLRGTIDKEVILDWVDILIEIMETSLMYSDPQHVINMAEKTIRENDPFVVVQLFLLKRCNLILPYTDLKQTLWSAIRRVRDIAYSIPKWEEEPKTVEKQPTKKTRKKKPKYILEELLE